MMPTTHLASGYPNAAPFIGLFIVCFAVFLVCLVKFPSLRVYRRKRNLLIYFALSLLLSLIAYPAAVVPLGPNYVSFGIDKTQTPIYSGQPNQFSVTCTSEGGKQASFYMVIKSANATLQVNGEEGYLQLNATAIKIPFLFQGTGEQTKRVHFTAEADVSSIEFYPSVERQNGDDSFIVTTWLSAVQCTWNPATASFVMADSMPLPVP